MVELYWLAGGIGLGVLLTVIYIALRGVYMRRLRKGMFNVKKFAPKPVSSNTAVKGPVPRRGDKTGPDTKKITLDERESKMSEVLSEMLELILRLAEIVVSTDSASGDAGLCFEQARKALENLDEDSENEIRELKNVLLSEIDNVVKSNGLLKQQLVKAQTGITNQKEEIDKLKTKAQMDTLTQLFNRAAFDDRLREVFLKWRHLREVFSLLMMDVDHFKQINDNYGHVHGDRILGEIAGKIKECIRDEDFAARYGGEEFAIILPDTPAEEALAVGTRIRETVERTHFVIEALPLKITVSGGIAQSGMAWTVQDMIDVADKALYISKNKGRNRITLGEDRIKEPWTTGEGTVGAPKLPVVDAPELPPRPE